MNRIFSKSKIYRRIKLELASRKSDPSFIHWWPQSTDEIWLNKFCKQHSIQNIVFGSVFGKRTDIEKRTCNKKHIFFSCENLTDRFTEYADHLLTNWDKGLGFEFRREENYLRFPLWIMYYVDPNSKNPGKDFEDKMNRAATPKNNFATLVASHDERGNGAGNRTLCHNHLKTIGPILSGGKLLKNTSLLTTQFQDDANAFIGSSQFNIALENSNAKGYCTEKVFRPFLTGTIPIYWGDNQLPEPSVINQDALLFFNPEQPEQLIHNVEELRHDKNKLRDFSNQRRTVPGAADWVNDKLQKLMEFLND